MTLARDLIDQAEKLANNEPRRPKQASLRRATSTAYYALFHLLTEDAATLLAPPAPVGLRQLIQRSFAHSHIKDACKYFLSANITKIRKPAAKTNMSNALEKIIRFPLDVDMVTVLDAFLALQAARHKADYDLSAPHNRLDVLANVALAKQAFAAWANVRRTPNAIVLASAIAFRKNWGRTTDG